MGYYVQSEIKGKKIKIKFNSLSAAKREVRLLKPYRDIKNVKMTTEKGKPYKKRKSSDPFSSLYGKSKGKSLFGW